MGVGVWDQAVALPRRLGRLAAGSTSRPWPRPLPAAVVVAVIGLIITVASAGLAVVLDRRNEQSLLQVQTRQAAAVLSATVLQISQPLTATAAIARATQGDPVAFQESIGAETGPGRLFVSAALVEVRGTEQRQLATVGVAPMLDPGSARGRRTCATPWPARRSS